jgi:hypothetical protein
MSRNVTFTSHYLKTAGHLYIPEAYRPGGRRAALVSGRAESADRRVR